MKSLLVLLVMLSGAPLVYAQACCEQTAQNTSDALYYLEAQNANIQAMTDGMAAMAATLAGQNDALTAQNEMTDALCGIVYVMLFFQLMFWGFGVLVPSWRSTRGLFFRTKGTEGTPI